MEETKDIPVEKEIEVGQTYTLDSYEVVKIEKTFVLKENIKEGHYRNLMQKNVLLNINGLTVIGITKNIFRSIQK